MSRVEKEKPQGLFERAIQFLKKTALESSNPVEKGSLEKRAKRDYIFLRLRESFNRVAREKYEREYKDLSPEEKIQVLSEVLPKDSENEVVKRTRLQVEEARKELKEGKKVSSKPEEKPEEKRRYSWDEEQRTKIRRLGKKIAEEQENPETTPFVSREDGDRIDKQAGEQEAQIIAEELKVVLFEEAKKELTTEILAKATALEFELDSIISDASLSNDEKLQKIRELQDAAMERGVSQEELYDRLIQKHKDAVEKEISSILSNPEIDINDYVDWAELLYRGKFKDLEKDFRLYAPDVRSDRRIVDDPERSQVSNNELQEILRFRIPDGASEEQKEKIFQDVLSYLDPTLDLIERRSGFSNEFQIDSKYQELRAKINTIASHIFNNEPELATKLEDRVNMILSLHDVNYGLTKPPFDRERIGTIQKSASGLTLKEVYGEMNRSILGVDAPIAKTAHYAEQALLEIIHTKPNHRFEQSDIPKLEQKLKQFVDQLYEGIEIDEQTKQRIIRRADRIFTVSLRKPLLIARESKLSDDPSRFEKDPYLPIISLWRPSYFLQQKWGMISKKEQEMIYSALGGAGVIDELMSDFNDPYSSGFRIARYIEALDLAGHRDAGLWMRIKEPGKSLDVFQRRKNAFERLIQKDTHMLPLLGLYEKDRELQKILSRHGFANLGQFEETVSTALFMKLQIQLRTPDMVFDPDKMSASHRKVLEENQPVIRELLSFLQGRKDDIARKLRLQFKPSDNHHHGLHSKEHEHDQQEANYLWSKVLSVSDIPTHVLGQYDKLIEQKEYWASIYQADLVAMYGIQERVNDFVRNPQDVEKLAEFIVALENQSGREGAQEKFQRLMKGVVDLNKPTWYSEWLPVIDLIPGLYASKIQKIRGKGQKAWDLGERIHIMHMLESKGIITPENEHFYRELLKVRLVDRLIPTIRAMILFGMAGIALLVISQVAEELSGGGSSSGGGH